MKSSTWPRISLFLILSLISQILAEPCTPEQAQGFPVSRQEELDLIASHCTEINGSLSFWPNYTGPAILPNVTNIKTINFATRRTETNVSSIEFPDLLHADAIGFYRTSTLRNLSFPRLENVSTLDLVFEAEVEDVQLPVLKSAEDVRIEGNFSKVSLGQLERVNGRVRVCNVYNCEEDALPARTSLDIDLSALQRVQELCVVGETVGIDLPKLSRIEDSAEIKGDISSFVCSPLC